MTVLLAKKDRKEKPLPAGGEEPAPPQPQSHPEVTAPEERPLAIMASAPPQKFPWILLVSLVGFLALLVVAGGIWWRWSQPVVVTKEVPASVPPTAEPPAKLSATEYYDMGNGAKDPEEKIKNYTKAIEINPYNAQYYYYRGLAYKAKALFPLAIEDFGKAIVYQANYPSAYISRGLSYYEMGQQDAAIADYTKAISLDPLDAVTFLRRGISYQKKGESDKALADYHESIKLRPNYVIALNNRGLIYYRRGENEKALADFNEALRLNPNYVLGYKNRAALYERMGDKDRAADDRNKVKSLDPKGLVRGF